MPGGGLIIFSYGGVSLYGLEFLDEKVGPFSDFFAPNGGLQNTILRAVLGKNGFHLKKNLKIVDF